MPRPDALHPSRSFRCCGVAVAALTAQEARDAVVDAGLARRGGDVHLCNAYTLSLADKDPAYRDMLDSGWLALPDGMSVVWASRWFARGGGRLPERVTGPDLLEGVLAAGVARGLRHYFYGGASREVLDAFLDEVRRRHPDLAVAGAEVPPHVPLGQQGRAALADRVRRSEADVVWVGLGTPKQDWACADLSDRVDAVVVAVGAAYDFMAGTRSRPPAWVQAAGLEWCFRLLQEPRRLWRRYLFGNSRFLYAVARKDR